MEEVYEPDSLHRQWNTAEGTGIIHIGTSINIRYGIIKLKIIITTQPLTTTSRQRQRQRHGHYNKHIKNNPRRFLLPLMPCRLQSMTTTSIRAKKRSTDHNNHHHHHHHYHHQEQTQEQHPYASLYEPVLKTEVNAIITIAIVASSSN